jgi:hypothetical protein
LPNSCERRLEVIIAGAGEAAHLYRECAPHQNLRSGFDLRPKQNARASGMGYAVNRYVAINSVSPGDWSGGAKKRRAAGNSDSKTNCIRTKRKVKKIRETATQSSESNL